MNKNELTMSDQLHDENEMKKLDTAEGGADEIPMTFPQRVSLFHSHQSYIIPMRLLVTLALTLKLRSIMMTTDYRFASCIDRFHFTECAVIEAHSVFCLVLCRT